MAARAGTRTCNTASDISFFFFFPRNNLSFGQLVLIGKLISYMSEISVFFNSMLIIKLICLGFRQFRRTEFDDCWAVGKYDLDFFLKS